MPGDDLLAAVVAGQLSSVIKTLFAEGFARGMAGESRAGTARRLQEEARRLFAMLEPSLGEYAKTAHRGDDPDAVSPS